MREGRIKATLLIVFVCVTGAEADIASMREIIQSDSGLIHHWTFEDLTRQLDSKGSADLAVVGTGSPVAYVPGYDQTTTAAQFFGGQSLHSASFLHPEAGTVEFLYRPDAGGEGHLVSTSLDRGWRLYYAVGVTADHDAGFTGQGVAFGTGPWSQSPKPLLSDATAPDLEYGHWYYVAVTRTHSGASVIGDAYIADLTENQQYLSHVIQSGVWDDLAQPFGTGGLGIGSQIKSPGNAGVGVVDEVAYYNRLLAEPELQGHLDALYAPNVVPLPGAVWLGAVGLGLVGVLRRRKATPT